MLNPCIITLLTFLSSYYIFMYCTGRYYFITLYKRMKTNRNILSTCLVALMLVTAPVSVMAETNDDVIEMNIDVTPEPVISVVGNQIEVEISDDDEHTVMVYALTGQIVKSLQASNGKTVIDLPRGYYIVKVDKTAKRVIIR